MTIQALRVPFVAVEFSNERAGSTAEFQHRTLIIGQKLVGGTGADGSIYRVTSLAEVATLAGIGSQLYRMATAYFANTSGLIETWVGIAPEPTGGVKTVKTITVTGPATAAGTLALYVAGTKLSISVANTDAASAVATAINAAINADTTLPVTSTVLAAVVTVTARNEGRAGDAIDLRLNYGSSDVTPAGIDAAFATTTPGEGTADLAGVISAMGERWFTLLVHPYYHADDEGAVDLHAELADRFGPLRMIDGLAFTSAPGEATAVETLAADYNSPHGVMLLQPGVNPVTPPEEFAAAVLAVVADAATEDPARPFQTLALAGVKAPAQDDLFTLAERDSALNAGVATAVVSADGNTVAIERLRTLYRLNAGGAEDESYREVNTLLTLMYLRWSFRQSVLLRYPRHKLADSVTRLRAGQAVMTPALMKAHALGWFRDMEARGLVQRFEVFKAGLVVERDEDDQNRLNVYLPPDLMRQLIVTAATIAFG